MRILLYVLLLAMSSTALAADWPTLPDHHMTQGMTVPGITIGKICTTKWGTDSRHVTAAMKQAVIDAYHFDVSSCPLTVYNGRRTRRIEIDHLISRELGGADVVENLWPQCYEVVRKNKAQQDDGAYKKDRLENKLHHLVCDAPSAKRKDLLAEYQQKIADDWISLYHEVFGDH